MLLDQITKANDIKKIKSRDYATLAAQIREFLLEKVSKSGGHLGANLGVVELTMALHLELDFPTDKLIWDVGHQCYTHKLLTGRRDGFDDLRSFGGMSGFPKKNESDCDCFNTGHSSTSLSAGVGMAKARDLQGENHTIISVIGDGSLTGGMAYEALNNAARLDSPFIIILNDNNMSISENVGGMSKYLNRVRTADAYLDIKEGVYNILSDRKYGDKMTRGLQRAKESIRQRVIPGMFFEDLGIRYMGMVDGHDIARITRLIRESKRINQAVLIHVITEKGRGYPYALKYPARFHGTDPFDLKTGLAVKEKNVEYTDVFSRVITKLAGEDERIVAITAAMPDGTGLKRFRKKYPHRFFDVGIAEEHAVTFAAGLAAGGMKPVVAIYSSFLQRGYDQIVHDVCLQNLAVVFAIDRAGLVGGDGETHHGAFDLSYLSSIPGLYIMAPKNKWELADMLQFALQLSAPVAIRYPRGTAYGGLEGYRSPIVAGKAEMIYDESDICLLAVGSMVKEGEIIRTKIKEAGYGCTLVNARFVKPFDEEMILSLAAKHKIFVTLEENVASGAFGEKVLHLLAEKKPRVKVIQITLPDTYIEHGDVDLLKAKHGFDNQSIIKKILAKTKK
ncbi:MAG: 1-deoxy-D-xylulose-5-phosphate synthase [Lachnospiraceae bacterium]|jgi:1-deoxy-D-xylulose-5-phosphate synthase|nr:1-deoxy-D-xylulose-5-phosphate synthase [Lachnospiraceae bacterium]